MLKRILVLVTMIVLPWTVTAADLNATASAVEGEVARIDSSLPKLRSTERDLRGVSAEGATVVAHADGSDIQKISLEALGERGKYLADFYFVRRRLVFARARRIDYGGDIMERFDGKALKHEVVEDDRLAFANRRVIGWHAISGEVPLSDPRVPRKQHAILTESKSLMTLMRTPDPQDPECEWSCSRPHAAACRAYRCD